MLVPGHFARILPAPFPLARPQRPVLLSGFAEGKHSFYDKNNG